MSCVLMPHQTCSQSTYLKVLEDGAEVHLSPAVSSFSSTKAEQRKTPQLMSYKTVGSPSVRRFHILGHTSHLHLNGGHKSSSKGVCHAKEEHRARVGHETTSSSVGESHLY